MVKYLGGSLFKFWIWAKRGTGFWFDKNPFRVRFMFGFRIRFRNKVRIWFRVGHSWKRVRVVLMMAVERKCEG